jgi:hypothetical protein
MQRQRNRCAPQRSASSVSTTQELAEEKLATPAMAQALRTARLPFSAFATPRGRTSSRIELTTIGSGSHLLATPITSWYLLWDQSDETKNP